MTTALNTANQIANNLRALTACKFRPRVWQGQDKDAARVYTGYASEYLEIAQDGTVTKSRVNMTWGQKIDEVIGG